MKGVTRSFWTLILIVSVLEGYVVYLALQSLHHVLPCWWSFVPHPTNTFPSCGESVALFGYNSWVPAAVILVLFSVTIAIAVATFVTQMLRTRGALNRLGDTVENPERLRRAQERIGVVALLKDDVRPFCCCAGLLRPRILISTGMLTRLDDEELLAVLAHERSHAKRRDPARATAVRVAARAFFFVPLAGHLSRNALVASELGADSLAVSIAWRDSLVRALVSILGEVRPALGGATEMASLESMDLRIEALRTKAVPRVRPSLGTVAMSAGGIGLIYLLSAWLPPLVSQLDFHPA
jgi:hypothetical protein